MQLQAQQKSHVTKASLLSTLKFVLQAAAAEEPLDQARKQPSEPSLDLVFVLNASKKSHRFPTTAQEDLAVEEEEEFKLSYPSLLRGKIQIMHRNILLTAKPL